MGVAPRCVMMMLCTQDGNTALLVACWSGHLEVVQWLVSSAGSNAATERDNVRTMMWVSATTIAFYGADSIGGTCCVCIQDGYTALLRACAIGKLKVVQWLVTSAVSNAVTEQNNVRIIVQRCGCAHACS